MNKEDIIRHYFESIERKKQNLSGALARRDNARADYWSSSIKYTESLLRLQKWKEECY